jgi:hypothetical protein
MARRVQLVRLVGACLALLASVVFCLEFSRFQLAALVTGAGYPVSRLPRACSFLAFSSHWLLFLPPLLLALGIHRLLRKRTESAGVEIVLQAAVLLAVVLALACVVAWQAPYASLSLETF